MPLVTLTTDYGIRDPYVANFKGELWRRSSDLQLVDISHNVNNFDIVQAAFIFKNAWRSFPSGTIHLLTVNDLPEARRNFLLVHQHDQFFVCPDNGILHLIFESLRGTIYRLSFEQQPEQPLEAQLALVVQQLSRKLPLEHIGAATNNTVRRLALQPVITSHQIRGAIIYIDNYDNAISNISRALFTQVGQGRPFAISFKRHPALTRLCKDYDEVAIGDPLCRFNRAGYLKFAVHMGRAASLLGLHLEEMIQIDFQEKAD